MSEFWKQFRARRENPCYTILGKRALWRRALPWLLSLLIFSGISLIEMNKYFLVFILLFSPIVFWLLVPITFLLTMPRRLDLGELQLTNMTRSEIAHGLMLRPFLASFVMLPFYGAFTAAGLYAMRSEFSDMDLLPMIGAGIVIDLVAFSVMQQAAIRCFSSNFHHPTKAFVVTVLFGAVLLILLGFFFGLLIGIGLMFGERFVPMSFVMFIPMLLTIIGAWIVVRLHVMWTWSHFNDRLLHLPDENESGSPIWFRNEWLPEELRPRRRQSVLAIATAIRKARWTILPTILVILAPWVLAIVLDSSKVPIWRTSSSSLSFMGDTMPFLMITVLATSVYLFRLSAGFAGRLPIVSGAIFRSVLLYLIAPVCICCLAFVLCVATQFLTNRHSDGDAWSLALCIALALQWIQVVTFIGARLRRAFGWWLLLSVLMLTTLLLDIRMTATAGVRFNPQGSSVVLQYLLAASGFLMFSGGIQLLLQHIHDTRLRNMPRGELSEPLP